ncbi:MAG: Dyp-type peroxidase [Pseudonocardia sp.]|nr:Dyp-type peroxidase [Pseudonocardia sp.]
MSELSRRRFVAAALGTGAAAGLTGCTAATGQVTHRPRFVPFAGDHQAGITALPIPAQGLLAAFSVQSVGRAGLASLFADLSDEIRGLMAGTPPPVRDPAYPPVDSGILGAQPPPDDLSIVVSVGASLFDDRFGLADRRPTELVTMPFLANDRLDPDRSHGDLLISLQAGHIDTLQFALRQLMRRTREHLVLAWLVEGYGRGAGAASAAATPRNLLGFKDGTANLDAGDTALMDRHVWVGADSGEPRWAVGGSYQAVRIIRMFVEFWDRTQLVEQEAIIGRHKITGAPLGRHGEFDDPGYADDPHGLRIPLAAHIRRANPRTPETAENLILRRGFSFTRGFDRAGRLDQGLAFVSYQHSLASGFLAVQERISGEALEEYVQGQGGGFFFALPGTVDGSRFLGDELVG